MPIPSSTCPSRLGPDRVSTDLTCSVVPTMEGGTLVCPFSARSTLSQTIRTRLACAWMVPPPPLPSMQLRPHAQTIPSTCTALQAAAVAPYQSRESSFGSARSDLCSCILSQTACSKATRLEALSLPNLHLEPLSRIRERQARRLPTTLSTSTPTN